MAEMWLLMEVVHMNNRCCLLFILFVVVLATMAGCATTLMQTSGWKDEQVHLAVMKQLFPGGQLPKSARNIHAYGESWPVGGYWIGTVEARTEEIEQAMNGSTPLPQRRQFFETGEAKTRLLGFNDSNPVWWKPGEASLFGKVSTARHWSDRLNGENKVRHFSARTDYYVALGDKGSGYSVLYIEIVYYDPEQEDFF
jgi:hypothetical protein